jgi:hypothetical protein
MADRFAGMSAGADGSARRHFAITPANTDLAFLPRALFIKAAGDVVIRDELGVDVTYTALAAGTVLPFRAVQVRTGTTATVVGWD